MRWLTPRSRNFSCKPVMKKAPFPGLAMTISPSTGFAASTNSLPGEPSTSSLPMPSTMTSPICLPGGGHRGPECFMAQRSRRSARWASLVCTTAAKGSERAASSSVTAPGMHSAVSFVTSFPKAWPKPPSSRKSFWKSMQTKAVELKGSSTGLGRVFDNTALGPLVAGFAAKLSSGASAAAAAGRFLAAPAAPAAAGRFLGAMSGQR
mmetsp:Transcript_84449/g.149416  ORF Transcript_84449/g.149416 Transcript_84449/m.149416 type:complete len:207 (+) Transcript_84449:343-963(+)